LATQPEPLDVTAEIDRLKRRLERERATRLEAEAIAEKGLRDLYQRQRELQTLERIAANANQGGSIREVLQFCLEEVCSYHDWKAGHGYLVHGAGREAMLRPANVWFATTPQALKPFHRVTKHSEFHIGEGLPGRALDRGTPVWIGDLSEDKGFPRLGVGWACGLRSAVSFPVFSGARIVAVLEFFDTVIREPSESISDMMRQIGTQLGRVIERQQAADALRAQTVELTAARDRAQAADRAKSAFLANMSHELRTPLNAVIGFSELMQMQTAGPLSERYIEYAGDIHRSGVHLKNVINDILDLSKSAVGALQLREDEVSLPNIVRACQRSMLTLAEAGQVMLETTVASDFPPLLADETRLQQIILNLLSNGVKFTPPGGKVTLTASLQADGGVLVEVRDSGIGMSAEDIAVAMEPFRQIDSSLSRRYEGTGLGLPLARTLTELHGGALTLQSQPSVGTSVAITLPASRVIRTVARASA
jgi:signal transduction histidine kinase